MDSWGRSNVYNSSSGSRYGKSVSNLATSNTTNANQINRYTSQLHNLPLNDGFQSWGQWGYEEVPPNDPYGEEEDRRPSWNSEKECNSRNSSLPADTHSECRRSLFDIDYEAETGLQLRERDDSPYNRHDLSKSDDSDESGDDIDELERDMELARRNAQHDWVPEMQSRKRDKSPCTSRDLIVANTEVEKRHDFAGRFENVAASRLKKRDLSPDWEHVVEPHLKKQNFDHSDRSRSSHEGNNYSDCHLKNRDYKPKIESDRSGRYRHLEETDSHGYSNKSQSEMKDNTYSKKQPEKREDHPGKNRDYVKRDNRPDSSNNKSARKDTYTRNDNDCALQKTNNNDNGDNHSEIKKSDVTPTIVDEIENCWKKREQNFHDQSNRNNEDHLDKSEDVSPTSKFYRDKRDNHQNKDCHDTNYKNKESQVKKRETFSLTTDDYVTKSPGNRRDKNSHDKNNKNKENQLEKRDVSQSTNDDTKSQDRRDNYRDKSCHNKDNRNTNNQLKRDTHRDNSRHDKSNENKNITDVTTTQDKRDNHRDKSCHNKNNRNKNDQLEKKDTPRNKSRHDKSSEDKNTTDDSVTKFPGNKNNNRDKNCHDKSNREKNDQLKKRDTDRDRSYHGKSIENKSATDNSVTKSHWPKGNNHGDNSNSNKESQLEIRDVPHTYESRWDKTYNPRDKSCHDRSNRMITDNCANRPIPAQISAYPNPQSIPLPISAYPNPQSIPAQISAYPNPQGIPAPISAYPNLQSISAQVSAYPNPQSIPAPISGYPNLQSIPAQISAYSNPQSIPAPISAYPNPQSIPAQINAYPNPQSIPAQINAYPNPQSIPAPISAYPNPQSIPAQINAYPNPQSIPAQINAYPNTQSIPAQISAYPNPQSIPAQKNIYPNWQSISAQKSAYPNPQSISAQKSAYPNPQSIPAQKSTYPNPQSIPPQKSAYPNPQSMPAQKSAYPNPQSIPPQKSAYPNPQSIPPQKSAYPNPQSIPAQKSAYPNPQSMPAQKSAYRNPQSIPAHKSAYRNPQSIPPQKSAYPNPQSIPAQKSGYPNPQSITAPISTYSSPQSNPTAVTHRQNIIGIRNKIQNTIAKILGESQKNPPQPGVSVDHPSNNSSTFLPPRLKKKQLNTPNQMVLKKNHAVRFMAKEGLDFLQALGEKTELNITLEMQKVNGTMRYVCVFTGPPSHKIEAQEAIERYLFPLGTRQEIKAVPFKSDCSFASLRENLEIIRSAKHWTYLASLRYNIVRKKERLMNACTNLNMQFDMVKRVQRIYSVLNAMILGRLDVADGPKHMQILRQWLQQSNENTAMTRTIGFSFNYVFNYDSALDIDYPEVINRLSNDEKLEEKLEINEMLLTGVAVCRVRGWTERLSHYRSLYNAMIINNYSAYSVDQFKKYYLQLQEDKAGATRLLNLEVSSKKQSLMNRELPIANSCALEQQALQGHSLKNSVNYNQLQQQNFSYVGGYNRTSNCMDYSHDYSEDIDCSNFIVPANQANLGVAETSSGKEDAPPEINHPVVIVESKQGDDHATETGVQSAIGGRQCGASTDASLGPRPFNFDNVVHKRKRKMPNKKEKKLRLMRKEQQMAAINAMNATHQNVLPSQPLSGSNSAGFQLPILIPLSSSFTLPPVTAQKLFEAEGDDFLRTLCEESNLKIDLIKEQGISSVQYVCTLQGPEAVKAKAKEAINKFCSGTMSAHNNK